MAANPMNDVIVLLPGILGSVLQRDGNDVWGLSGGAIGKTLLTFGSSLKNLALVDTSEDPDVAADGVTAPRLLSDVHLIPGLWKIDGYTKVADFIKANFDVQEGANFFQFPYDWRRSNRVSAKQLAAKTTDWLAKWRQRPGKEGAKLILLGHSMGGLVARYFLECLDGWRQCRALVTFGTPYRGSLSALDTLGNGLKVGFGPLSLDLSPLAQSMPSLHQLLPIYECYDAGGGELGRVYEVPGIPNLDRDKAVAANAFHREIEAAVDRHLQDNVYQKERYGIYAVVGRTQRTLQSARLAAGGKIEMLPTYKGEDMEGDGTVPKVSATPIEMADTYPRIFADELHASLQNSDAVLVNLAGILSGFNIKGDKFQLIPSGREKAVRLRIDDAYQAAQPVTMDVAPNSDWADLEAAVVDVDSNRTIQTLPVGPAGAAQRQVTFAGLDAGTYRVTVSGDGVTSVHDVFAVF